MTDEKKPAVSVVVVSYNARATIGRCLEALRNQTVADGFEIVMVDSSVDGTAEFVRENFPEVRMFSFGERKYPGDARNLAITRARGDLIAFVDSDCVADENWLEEILRIHCEDHPVVGGAVDNASIDRYLGWAYYFNEFYHWMPGARKGPMGDIPTCTLSLKRWAFEKWGPYLEGTYCSDSAFNWKMASDGNIPFFTPAIRVSHIYEGNLSKFLRHEVQHGRFFGVVRVREEVLGPGLRAYNALCAPFRPVIWFARIARAVFEKGNHRGRFLAVSPAVFLGRIAWAWGELLGYLAKSEPQSARGE